MEIVGEFQSIDTDKGIWEDFKRHWLSLFPNLKTPTTFLRQAANLWMYKQELQKLLAGNLGAFSNDIYLVDGIPIPLCCLTRSCNNRNFDEEANHGYCAAKKLKYYGFKGHLIINLKGAIAGFTVTKASGSEREALWEIIPGIQGTLIGDKGYISSSLQKELAAHGINLQTPLRHNMKDERPQSFVKLLQKTRRLIKTVIGQLKERFNWEKVWARDSWHLTSRFNRKLLAHTVCVWLNRHSHSPLQFEKLVTS